MGIFDKFRGVSTGATEEEMTFSPGDMLSGGVPVEPVEPVPGKQPITDLRSLRRKPATVAVEPQVDEVETILTGSEDANSATGSDEIITTSERAREATEAAAESAADLIIEVVESIGTTREGIASVYGGVDIVALEEAIEKSNTLPKMAGKITWKAISHIPILNLATLVPPMCLVYLAHRAGVPRHEIKQMIVNILLHKAVPVVQKHIPIPFFRVVTYVPALLLKMFFDSSKMNEKMMQDLIERAKKEREANPSGTAEPSQDITGDMLR